MSIQNSIALSLQENFMIQHLTSIHWPKHHEPNGKKVSTQSRHVPWRNTMTQLKFTGVSHQVLRPTFKEKKHLAGVEETLPIWKICSNQNGFIFRKYGWRSQKWLFDHVDDHSWTSSSDHGFPCHADCEKYCSKLRAEVSPCIVFRHSWIRSKRFGRIPWSQSHQNMVSPLWLGLGLNSNQILRVNLEFPTNLWQGWTLCWILA